MGCIIDSSLNWKHHVQYVKQKLVKCISILYKAGRLLDSNSLLLLYSTLFLPYLTYCSEVWGLAGKSITNCLVLLQKKAVRIIAKAEKYSHTDVIFKTLGILKFHDLVELKLLLIAFKAKYNMLPNSLQKLFVAKDHKYDVRKKDHFKTIYVRTNLKANCFSIFCVKLFDKLLPELKCISNFTKPVQGRGDQS